MLILRSISWTGSARSLLMAVYCLGLSPLPAQHSRTGLVASYSFDEGIGTAVSDSSGNGNTGVTTTVWAGGKYGTALSFDGKSTLVVIHDSQSLHLTSGMTLEAWVNPNAASNSWQDVIYKGLDDYFLEAASDQGPPGGGATFGPMNIALRGHSPLPIHVWTYLTLTYDGSALSLYINGVLDSRTPATGNLAVSGGDLSIGGDAIYGQHFSGMIDDVRLYNRPLQPAEILDDMVTPVGQLVSVSAAPLLPVIVSAVAVSSSQVNLFWIIPPGSAQATTYRVFRDGRIVGVTYASSFVDAGVSPGTTYTYTVVAVDSSGNASSPSVPVTVTTPMGPGPSGPPDTIPPSVPTGLMAFVTYASVSLSWQASIDNVAVAGYLIRRDNILIGTTRLTTYTDTTLTGSRIYSFTVSAFDAAGNESALSAPVSVTTAGPPAPVYPLKVSANRRYLVDQTNQPFPIIGDSPQSLIANLGVSDAEFYFANRSAAGYNTVWINLLCDTYTAGRPDGSTFDGILPFTTVGDLSTPNEPYFSRVDSLLRLAARYGLNVILDPIETGGWLDVLRQNGIDRARNYGRFLGARYRDFDNIIWMSGNDFSTWYNPDDDALVLGVVLGIQDTDLRHIHTVELNSNGNSLDAVAWTPFISLNAAYTYYPTYAEVLRAYNNRTIMPVFLVEANYEFENDFADYGSPAVLRRQAYWTMLSGAAGQLYGNRYTWQFADQWQAWLSTKGSAQIGYLRTVFAPRRWFDLIPDQQHAIVTAGYGTPSSGGLIATDDYATAAVTSDATLAIVYLPSGNVISVDMSKFAGPVTANWYDPTNGTYTRTSTAALLNVGTLQFTPPGSNSDGAGDWVLVLEVL